MTPHDLLAVFETLAEAPDGITQLRELVLQLAVQGKLVPQDPNDEPACMLLERIAAEKAHLVKEGMLAKPKPLPPVGEDEVPFEVPEGWALVPFGEVFVDIFTGPFGTALKASEYIGGGTPVINPQNMKEGTIRPKDDTCIGPETLHRLSTFIVYERDVIVARRGEMGRCAVVSLRESGWLCGTGSLVLRPPKEIVPQYVTLFLRSPSTVMRLAGDAVGSTMSNLNQRIMVNLPFGLPSLPEQHRIVAKVDALMALLDRLEATQRDREATRAALRDVALAALRDASDAGAVEATWSRVAKRMDDLFTDPADVAPLRQTILQLAVRGKLVSQDPNNEPACVLLERIAVEKAQLVKAGKLPKPKLLPPVGEDEVPFEVPEGWMWCRVDDCFEVAGGIQKSWKRQPVHNSFPYLRVANVQRGWLDLGEIYEFELFEGELDRWRLKAGDLLVVEGNGSEDEIGRCARWNGEVVDCVHQNHLIRCRPLAASIEHFVLRYLNSPAGIETMKALAVTTSGLYNLSVGKIRDISIPLPPLPEQYRIVAKVDALMALCDALETHLAAAREAQAAFAAAAVHHLDT
jgi:type I restriction enzyme S subunit